MKSRVAVLGASGFVGRHVMAALTARGVHAIAIPAPRLSTSARTLDGVCAALGSPEAMSAISKLCHQLAGCRVVINAAGIADATAGGDALFGADALLPGVVASATPDGARLLHVSSAAVQGRRPVLDESQEYAPFSEYSAAKAVGEQVARAVRPSTIVFRPTSVQGVERLVTRQLSRFARTPVASVAGRGDRPTPQVLVENVADAIAFVAMSEEIPPPVVLQPWEGLTTGSLLVVLGAESPHRVPTPAARLVVWLLFLAGGGSSKVAGLARRLEMLWFGQGQAEGWLASRWSAPYGGQRWEEVA